MDARPCLTWGQAGLQVPLSQLREGSPAPHRGKLWQYILRLHRAARAPGTNARETSALATKDRQLMCENP